MIPWRAYTSAAFGIVAAALLVSGLALALLSALWPILGGLAALVLLMSAACACAWGALGMR